MDELFGRDGAQLIVKWVDCDRLNFCRKLDGGHGGAPIDIGPRKDLILHNREPAILCVFGRQSVSSNPAKFEIAVDSAAGNIPDPRFVESIL